MNDGLINSGVGRGGKADRGIGYFVAAAAVAAVAYGVSRRGRAKYSFRDKSVLITGGSRGLGLVLARHLVRAGARIAIAARDGQELDRAGRELRNIGGDVIEIVADVSIRDQAENAVRRAVEYFGEIDCLINNAGVIQAGPLESQTEDDFREAMDTHFWGPYFMTTAAVEHMRKSGGGRVINIASVAGKVAVPHLAPYSASKFALAGLSSAMRSELMKDDIVITTVYPGLMRTGSHVNAEFKGQHNKEFAMFSLLDATPLTSIDVDRAASQILAAAARGDAELVITNQAKIAVKVNALFPEMTAAILGTVGGVLPGPKDSDKSKHKGLESQSILSPSIITAAIDAEAEENNELKPGEEI